MTTRDAILDAAMQLMRTHGLVRTTTKEIAQAAGFSEGMLYRHFASKTDIFLCVLSERLPPVSVLDDHAARLAGTGTLEGNLVQLVAETSRFYLVTFPIAGTLFSDPEVLDVHSREIRARGTGPEIVVERICDYLRAEQQIGRVAPAAPIAGAARAIVGASFWRAFLARFDDPRGTGRGNRSGHDDTLRFAEEIVASVLPGLTPAPSAAAAGDATTQD